AFMVVGLAPAGTWAQTSPGPAPAVGWTGPMVPGPVSAIFTPASGALLVRASDGLLRSDDGGQTFRSLALPHTAHPAQRVIDVDPNNQDALYASGDELLYRSTDAGSSWQVILPMASHPGFALIGLAISPANSSILYAALTDDNSRDVFVLLGSRDSGATWTTLQTTGPASLCGWGVRLFEAHPTDATRVFLSSGCFAGRNFGASLQQSTDQGKTFQDWWKFDASGGPLSGYPHSLTGGAGAAPARWYLAVNRDPRLGGSVVVRSDDDGMTWTAVLTYTGGGAFGPAGSDPNAWNIQIAGLADDPSTPDTLYVARTAVSPVDQSVQTSGVTTSSDGGVTWSDLGSQQQGQLADLALGIDGQNLYLASDQGLFQLSLASAPSDSAP
ncbi:MAG: hypothetical protein JO057_26720, partial [Chloroflexi bacterium]|nr:hypothetical protein [Chloroflexota bacterium]